MLGLVVKKLEKRGGAVGFLVGIFRRFAEQDGFLKAAAIAYFGIFSLFPLLLVSVAIMGYLLPTAAVHDQMENFIELYAPGTADLLITNLESLVENRGQVGLVGIVALLWVSSAVFSAITRSLGLIWGESKNKPFWRTKLVGILMVLFMGFLVLLSIGISAAFSVFRMYEAQLMEALGLMPITDTMLWSLVPRLVPPVFTFIAFSVIYMFFPAAPIRFRQVWLGALVGTVAFEVAKTGFVWYLQTAPDFRLIHGSLTALIVLQLWFYIAATILLLGAVVNVQIREQYGGGGRHGATTRSQDMGDDPTLTAGN